MNLIKNIELQKVHKDLIKKKGLFYIKFSSGIAHEKITLAIINGKIYLIEKKNKRKMLKTMKK